MSRSIYFLTSVETHKFAHKKNKDSREIDQIVLVIEKKNAQKKDNDNDQDSAAIGMKIAKKPNNLDKKTAIQGPRIENRKNTIETAKKEIIRKKITKTIRSRSSIRKNTRKTDQDQKRGITQTKDETEIKKLI